MSNVTEPTEAARVTARTPADRARIEALVARARAGDFGGAKLKLQVFGSVEGYHLFWANDQNAEIEQFLSEGFEFVHPSEVNMQSRIVQDDDVAGKVSKYVGGKEDGKPMRAYLLKCVNELWDARQEASQRQADVWDGAIRRGDVDGVDDSHLYTPKGYQTKLQQTKGRLSTE
jgi:hypothetical protein